MLRTFFYTLNISLLTIAAQAQVKDSIPTPAKDTTIQAPAPARDSLRKGRGLPRMAPDTSGKKPPVFKERKPAPLPDSIYESQAGIRIGLDVSRFALMGFQPYRKDITVQADIRIGQKMYAAIETGWNHTAHSNDNYTYKGTGLYSTIGVDYDFLKKKEPSEQNMLFAGVRYGFAHTTYEVPTYLIKNTYWNTETTGSQPSKNINSHWVELVLGLRVEAFKNFFLSWGVRQKIMLSSGATDAFPPIVIAGFGSGSRKSQFDLNYGVSYMIPLYKVKVHVKRQPVKE